LSQGKFSKEEAESVKEAVEEMFEAIPKSRRIDYLGHLNDVLLFLTAAGAAAPSESAEAT